MKVFLTFSDLELEFLGALDIYPVGNMFQNLETGQEYRCIGGHYGPIKEFGNNDSSYYTYEFKGKEGTITFIRSDYTTDDLTPSLMIKYNRDVAIYFGLSDQNEPHRLIGDEETDEVKNIMKDIKRITIQILNPRGKKRHPAIRFTPYASDTLSITYLLDGMKSVSEIDGRLTCISSPKEFGDYAAGLDEYYEALRDEIKRVFDEQQIQELFLRFLPIFNKAYKATLHIPAIFEEKYRIRYQNEIASTEHRYGEIINNYQEEKDKALQNIKNNAEFFEEIIGKYPLNGGKQK